MARLGAKLMNLLGKVIAFLDMMDSSSFGSGQNKHWGLSLGFKYFMAQCPIILRDQSEQCSEQAAPLDFLASDLPNLAFASSHRAPASAVSGLARTVRELYCNLW